MQISRDPGLPANFFRRLSNEEKVQGPSAVLLRIIGRISRPSVFTVGRRDLLGEPLLESQRVPSEEF